MIHKNILTLGLIVASVGSFASAQLTVAAQFVDLDGDGVVSEAEVGAQVRDDLVALVRKHSDGYLITNRSAIVSGMKAYLLALSGDFDNDGEVTISDIVAQAASAGAVDPSVPGFLQGDLNGDGVVDATDMLLTSREIGQHTALTDEQVEFLWADLLDAADEYEVGPTRDEVFGPPRTDDHRGPDGHNQVITSSWPPYPFQMAGAPPVDWSWPANHAGAASMTWNDQSSPNWPANHVQAASVTWGVYDPANHSHALSMQDNPMNPSEPPNNSNGWPAGHTGPVSGTWDDSPGHDSLLSQMWPAGHQLANSNSGVVGQNDHIGFISGAWDAAGHQETTSDGWPANHHIQISMNWFGHDTVASATWPPNHLSIFSNAWPEDHPAFWPANHLSEVSASWSDPNPGDHSWRATIHQDFHGHPVEPLIPGLLLDLWLSQLR